MNYNEDMQAQFDLNLAITGSGKYVEIQGTAEGRANDQDQLTRVLGLAQKGVQEILDKISVTLAEHDVTLPSHKKPDA